MPKFTHKEGNVTLSYEPPIDASKSAVEKLLFGENPKFAQDNWNILKSVLKERFKYIIQTAPEMVQAAQSALDDYVNLSKNNALSGNNAGKNPPYVWDGLAKYFALLDNTTATYWSYLTGIRTTFDLMKQGLSGEYEIALKLPGIGVMGDAYAGALLDGVKTLGVSPIRQRFGGEDMWGHVEWQGFKGPLQFSAKFFAEGEANVPPDKINAAMARVLVHEASHRWGNTTDVLYKNSTWGKKASVYDKGKLMNQTEAERLCSMAFLHTEIEAGRASGEVKYRKRFGQPVKPFVGMGGNPEGGKEGATKIEDKRWLENADSYAWFAKRMWKHPR
jgi:hypothetical protein